MSAPIPILVPQEDVNDTSARVVRFAAATGQQVSAGQVLVELETSKTTLELSAPAAGWLRLTCAAGDDLPVGGVIGQVFDSKSALDTALQPAPSPPLPSPSSPPVATQLAPAHAVVTVFSDEARAALQAAGLDESAFAGRSFVRAADVRALLQEADTTPSMQPAPPRAAHEAKDTPLVQTFADGWPLLALIRADLHRIDGRHDFAELLRQWFWNPGFSYVLWFRIAQWCRQRAWAKLLLYPVALWSLHRRNLQSGIRIPLSVNAGPGLLVAHWGSIWLNPACTLGANCTLGNDINFGSAGTAGKGGVPQLGDNVFIGPGARLAGALKIGHDVAVMANTLVTADVPPGSIVIGVPHRISGRQRTNTFVSHTDYPRP
ncbi:MAG: hypothetical protein K1X78_04705 [Verrucomicrobiaceae bacterium]|nr:hypothetical protein [Verrucomicrobiaceae bacterium]